MAIDGIITLANNCIMLFALSLTYIDNKELSSSARLRYIIVSF